MNYSALAKGLALCALLAGCERAPEATTPAKTTSAPKSAAAASTASDASGPQKAVVYQVFTRLYGNTQTANVPWGTAEQNGVGKFSDFTDTALADIKSLGTTHVWYTGVPHHALARDYTAFGISNDDPDVIKGRAGSPYAVKDYYSVNPDLAEDPAQRLAEFDALIARTHSHGMKVLIDIVPNHVARNYESLGAPAGVEDFGAKDDTSKTYARDNNFYYVVGEAFQVPEATDGYQPLGGDAHPLVDGKFAENPAKWTGNGSRAAQPDINDWYETVKVNYGVRPDGSYDFPRLPPQLRGAHWREHAAFWADKDVPDSWQKFHHITQFWLARGVDGFRYDMAEMVPVEFWSYLNSAIKQTNPQAFILAEVYNPAEYRNYIQLGLMDYLYDKVELYDTLKAIIQGRETPAAIVPIQERMQDIEHHMLHFLENHDEQRIASPEFAGNPIKALPAMVVSATLSSSPTMLYFGQDVGEPGAQDAGFGKPSRTSIFDYIGVPHHQRWMNNGAFDGGQSLDAEKALRAYYQRLMNLSVSEPAFTGNYQELHSENLGKPDYPEQLFSFARWTPAQRVLVVSNFSSKPQAVELLIPADLTEQWGELTYAKDLLEGHNITLKGHHLAFNLPAYGSAIIELGAQK
ncbi:alpha-amylase [Simiduia sp. 21SJ11W-1]|uniref:alpha-amylase family glycosyl hydrolase n=1 Tax=Simiduia sp. 21SJ11W-1 TaxID=2909669 RepID=UPI00209EFF1B|nr:alpha-amylase family glycosyl hydrolase [Simiduia sp. 21SJ11W-1]UTA47729.1 alpha-amylase [Simiduia sp. 21SJ11W-1]